MKKCRNHGRRFCGTCLLATLGFPVEHALYVYVPGFRWVGGLFGL